MNAPRIKEIEITTFYWDNIDKVVKAVLKESEHASRHILPDFDTIEQALREKDEILLRVARKYNRVPIKKVVTKEVIREDQIDWS
jgi:hypothetical protein